MWRTKVDRLGRTSIPAEIRKRLGIRENDEVIWVLENDRAYIVKQNDIDVEELIAWLRRNAPECFTENVEEEEFDKWGFDKKWVMRKIGLKQ